MIIKVTILLGGKGGIGVLYFWWAGGRSRKPLSAMVGSQ